MYPHVAAYNDSGWNSPNCGKCMPATYNGKTVYFTLVDGRSAAPWGFEDHNAAFNLSREDYFELFGQ